MVRMLERLGFYVIKGENLSRNQMGDKIFEFGARLRKERGVGLFYFAGHGVQVNGMNYLIPIGADIPNEKQVEFQAINVNIVLAEMEEAMNGMNIVILDACRNNPFARRFRSTVQGLASIDAPLGTFIAYATQPGSIAADGDGENGLYTGELVNWMQTPQLGIEDLFKRVRISVAEKSNGVQVPWESSSLVQDFYFNPYSSGMKQPPLGNDIMVPVAKYQQKYWWEVNGSKITALLITVIVVLVGTSLYFYIDSGSLDRRQIIPFTLGVVLLITTTILIWPKSEFPVVQPPVMPDDPESNLGSDQRGTKLDPKEPESGTEGSEQDSDALGLAEPKSEPDIQSPLLEDKELEEKSESTTSSESDNKKGIEKKKRKNKPPREYKKPNEPVPDDGDTFSPEWEQPQPGEPGWQIWE